MSHVILQTATRFMMPLLLVFSVFLLVRGHNLPGGGFIGGLIGVSAFALYALAFDIRAARMVMRIDPQHLLAAGLIVALASVCLPLLRNLPLLTHRYSSMEIPILGLGPVYVGTPLLFDLGVYLVVLGAALTIVFSLADE
jgi:multicomponent Na+:H+ antiporter subunit B